MKGLIDRSTGQNGRQNELTGATALLQQKAVAAATAVKPLSS
jgi:hypothetical protein